MKTKMRLVTRADDAGSCRSANEAILECVEAGIIKNVSFMAVGPEIEHAVELLGGRNDIAYGLHVCLNSEWEDVKWGPVGTPSILMDEHGHFLPFPNDTQSQLQRTLKGKTLPHSSFFLKDVYDLFTEVGDEVRAQLKCLQELGLNPSYVDEHMGVSWISPDIRSTIASLQLFDAHPIPSLPASTNTVDDFLALQSRLKSATGNEYVWVTHPGKIAPDMNAFHLKGQQPGIVARERDTERRLLLDSRLPELFSRLKVRVARYDELNL